MILRKERIGEQISKNPVSKIAGQTSSFNSSGSGFREDIVDFITSRSIARDMSHKKMKVENLKL